MNWNYNIGIELNKSIQQMYNIMLTTGCPQTPFLVPLSLSSASQARFQPNLESQGIFLHLPLQALAADQYSAAQYARVTVAVLVVPISVLLEAKYQSACLHTKKGSLTASSKALCWNTHHTLASILRYSQKWKKLCTAIFAASRHPFTSHIYPSSGFSSD